MSVPIRAELRAGDERMGLHPGQPARDARLGACRPDAPRPVRQRDRGRHPERRAVQPGPGPEPPAPSPERGQGRLPARRQPQPADAADVHPVERRRPRRRTITTRACGSSPSRPTACRGWSSSCSSSAGSSRSRPGRPRTSWPSRRGSSAPGTRSRSPTGRCRSATARRTGSPSPTATSSTRCSGRSSTTPSSTARARSTVAVGADPETRTLWATISDQGHGLEESDRAWLFGRFERGAAGRTSGNGSGLGLYVSRALMRGMGGDLVLDPVEPGHGATFRLTLPGEPPAEG